VNELDELYQQVLLDHYRSPRHYGRPAGADREAAGFNPLCGDRVKLFLGVEGERIRALGFEGSGCAISTASASLLCEALQGASVEEAHRLAERFHAVVTGEAEPDDELGKLAALAGVSAFPMRVKCATLAWHALEAALAQSAATVTTECSVGEGTRPPLGHPSESGGLTPPRLRATPRSRRAPPPSPRNSVELAAGASTARDRGG
jgi:nitrogen fixation NifU-like protein